MRSIISLCLLIFFVPLLYSQGKAFDLVINELMVKPAPSVGLPSYEYVELFNRTDNSTNINRWKLGIGALQYELPNYVIEPHGYVLIVKEANEAEFIKYINIVGINSLSLNDEGQEISLYNKSGEVISYFRYDMNWWSGDAKRIGGWSLEQIDAGNPCGGVGNWRFSTNRNGGTPAAVNAVKGDNKDTTQPLLIRAAYIDSSNIELHFSETVMNVETLTDPSIYFIDNGMGMPDSVKLLSNDNQAVRLNLGVEMRAGVVYTLSVMNGLLCDCVGNMLVKDLKVMFGIPDEIQEGELLISEIMFNPIGINTQWIELFNNSDKLFNLLNTAVVINDKVAYPKPFYLFPHEYIVLKKGSGSIGDYNIQHPYNILPVNDMTAMNVKDGVIKIVDKGDATIVFDEAYYSTALHHPVIADKKGVSLERVSMEESAMELSNWQSAAATVGFATPTYSNSVKVEYKEGDEQWLLSSDIFSPDNDGYEDMLGIIYNLAEAGQTAIINIYNQNGTLVRKLSNNLLLSSKGTILWNGADDSNRKSEIGIYIIDIKLLDLQGNRHNKKLVVTVAARL